jgi:hypothetical protein
MLKQNTNQDNTVATAYTPSGLSCVSLLPLGWAHIDRPPLDSSSSNCHRTDELRFFFVPLSSLLYIPL